MKSGVFVTGTDTNIGKTISCALIVKAFLNRQRKVGYWKSIQTGTDSDRRTVLELTGISPKNSPEPIYEYPESLAPSRAASLHGEAIELSRITDKWNQMSDELFWIVEGAGGLLVPLVEKKTMADLAKSLDLPILIVAGTRLGTMNHLLLTLEAAGSRELKILGVLWVGDADPGLEYSLDPWLRGLHWTQRVPRIEKITEETIRGQADLISVSKIESYR